MALPAALVTAIGAMALPAPAAGGDDFVLRSDFVKRRATGEVSRKPLISFVLLSDLHQADEELTLPSRTNWRNWAAVAPHMLNAQVRAVNAIAARGGPELGQRISMLFSLGDASDNAQYNETRLAIDVLDGGKLVDPGSGTSGYDNKNEPDRVDSGRLHSPVAGKRVLDLANEPFYAPGLRSPDGSPLPWYSIHGNHNTKVMGGIPHENAAWRKVADAWATGDLKIFGLNARLSGELARIRKDKPEDEPSFWMRTFALAKTKPRAVGDVRHVPADAGRRILSKQQWIDEHAKTSGAPVGHGFLPTSRRCPDAYEGPDDRRACFAFDEGRFRFIALDDNALNGYTTGSVDRAQFKWLERELMSASHAYLDEHNRRVVNDRVKERYVVVLNHHTSKGLRNSGTIAGTNGELLGKDLERLLLRFPNVILHATGHSHSNRAWPHRDKAHGTGYWEVSTTSVVDHPHEGRTVEVADNGDGTISVFSKTFRPDVGAQPETIGWDADDPTDETKHGGKHAINEDWLAAAGFRAAADDIHDYRYGEPKDRDVELPLLDPLNTEAVSTSRARRDLPLGAVVFVSIVLLVAFLLGHRRPRMPPRRPRTEPKGPEPRTTPARTPVGAGRTGRRAA